MKYIRTKDRIYDGSRFLREYTGWYFNEKSKLYAFTESEIVKQADTIPELCDVVIFKTKDYRGFKGQLKLVDLRIAAGTKEDLRNYLVSQMRSELFEFAYLGIETDKSIVYVAKMNDKGELELL